MRAEEGLLEHEFIEGVHVFRVGVDRANVAGSLSRLEQEVRRLIKGQGGSLMVVDLVEVAYLPTPALAQLISLKRQVAAEAGRLTLCGLRPGVREALGFTGLDREFEVYADRDEAIAQMQGGEPSGPAPEG